MDWLLETKTLDMKHFDKSKTAANIKGSLDGSLAEMKLTEKVI